MPPDQYMRFTDGDRMSINSERSVRDLEYPALTPLYKNEEDADIILVCGKKTWKAHKSVLRAYSKYFHAALKPGGFMESLVNQIEIDETLFAASTIDRMLEYVYTGQYTTKMVGGCQCAISLSNHELLDHVNVYAAAQYYTVDSLLKYAAINFKNACHEKTCPRGFGAVIDTVDTKLSNDKHFMDAMVHFGTKHASALTEDADYQERLRTSPAVQRFQHLLVPAMALAIKDLNARLEEGSRYAASPCWRADRGLWGSP